MPESELSRGNEGQLRGEDLDDIVARIVAGLQHPGHVVSPKEFAGIWGTAPNNVKELRERYPHYFTPKKGITLSNLVAMSKESFRNPRNRSEEKEKRQAARIERIMNYDRSLDGALTNEIAQAALQEPSSLILYQGAVEKQRKGQIDPTVVIYNPFMRPEDVAAMARGQKIYHPNPRWTNDNTTWVNEGIFAECYRFKEAREKGPGIIVGMLVDFPDVGIKRLVVDFNSEHYQNSARPDERIWGGYVRPSVTARR